MESVGTELFNLLQMAGVPFTEERTILSDVTTDAGNVRTQLVSVRVPFPVRRLTGYRNSSGDLAINVANGECLAITLIEAFNLDYSGTNTVQIFNSTDTFNQAAQPIEVAANSASLYVFRPGTATFRFVITALPTATPRVQVHGYRLPNKALEVLARLSNEVIAQ